MKKFMIMKNNDNVASAMETCHKSEEILIIDYKNKVVMKLNSLSEITYGNKIALRDISKGEEIIKYDSSIGKATKDIKKGQLVHVHNVISNRIDIPEEIKKEIIRQMKIEVVI